MIRRPPRSTRVRSSAASDVYKRQLTAWELLHEGISAELITDSMAGYFLSTGAVTQVIVGADRIAANGDTANKIGTYPLSVLAREHGVPFYVAAPLSTVDLTVARGAG